MGMDEVWEDGSMLRGIQNFAKQARKHSISPIVFKTNSRLRKYIPNATVTSAESISSEEQPTEPVIGTEEVIYKLIPPIPWHTDIVVESVDATIPKITNDQEKTGFKCETCASFYKH